MAPSTPDLPWCIVRVFADGRREFVTMAGEPWTGPEDKARNRATVMQTEEPNVTFVVITAPPASGSGNAAQS